MIPPVKKSDDEYYISYEYHTYEMSKYFNEEKKLKEEVSKLKKENTELKEQLAQLLKKI